MVVESDSWFFMESAGSAYSDDQNGSQGRVKIECRNTQKLNKSDPYAHTVGFWSAIRNLLHFIFVAGWD